MCVHACARASARVCVCVKHAPSTLKIINEKIIKEDVHDAHSKVMHAKYYYCDQRPEHVGTCRQSVDLLSKTFQGNLQNKIQIHTAATTFWQVKKSLY